MFKENKKSNQSKSRVSQTARSNTTRKDMSNMYKLTVNNELISERKMSINSSSSKMNQDQITEKRSKLQSSQQRKLEPSIFKVPSGVIEPPLPEEWGKSPRQVYKVDEYQIIQGEKEQYTERLKKSKVDYTFKYKHLNNKILNFDKVKELFKKKETMLSDNEISESEHESIRIASEKKKKKIKIKKAQIKRGYSKLQDELHLFTNEMGIPSPTNNEPQSATNRRSVSTPGFVPKAPSYLEKFK